MVIMESHQRNDKPKKIPQHKWITKGKEYTIIFALHVVSQNTLAFQLDERNLKTKLNN